MKKVTSGQGVRQKERRHRGKYKRKNERTNKMKNGKNERKKGGRIEETYKASLYRPSEARVTTVELW